MLISHSCKSKKKFFKNQTKRFSLLFIVFYFYIFFFQLLHQNSIFFCFLKDKSLYFKSIFFLHPPTQRHIELYFHSPPLTGTNKYFFLLPYQRKPCQKKQQIVKSLVKKKKKIFKNQ